MVRTLFAWRDPASTWHKRRDVIPIYPGLYLPYIGVHNLTLQLAVEFETEVIFTYCCDSLDALSEYRPAISHLYR